MEDSILESTTFVVFSGNSASIKLLDIFTKGKSDFVSRITNAQNEIRQRVFEYVKNKYDFSINVERFRIQIIEDGKVKKCYGILGIGKRFVIATTNSRSGEIEKVKEFASKKEMDAFVDNLTKRDGVSSFYKDGNLLTCDFSNGREEIYLMVDSEL